MKPGVGVVSVRCASLTGPPAARTRPTPDLSPAKSGPRYVSVDHDVSVLPSVAWLATALPSTPSPCGSYPARPWSRTGLPDEPPPRQYAVVARAAEQHDGRERRAGNDKRKQCIEERPAARACPPLPADRCRRLSGRPRDERVREVVGRGRRRRLRPRRGRHAAPWRTPPSRGSGAPDPSPAHARTAASSRGDTSGRRSRRCGGGSLT